MYEEYTSKCGGDELAKVLWYYGFIEHISGDKEQLPCPFHDETNPSLSVDLESGVFTCFGCEASGNAIRFVQMLEHKRNGLNDLQGGRKYIQILRSEKCSNVSMLHILKEKKSPKQMYLEAYDYYHGLSSCNWQIEDDVNSQAKQYMKKRGFSGKTLNLCKAKVNYNQSYGIIFPMFDNGKFKGWVCRTMIKEVEEKRKYLYNKGFRRKLTLVGDYTGVQVLFIVEGYMDRLKFIQNGVTNVVAILGWKMSDCQYKKIQESCPNAIIVSALDNDRAGKKGSEYLERLFGERYVRFAYMKGIKDPGETNSEQFEKMFRKTMMKVTKQVEQ